MGPDRNINSVVPRSTSWPFVVYRLIFPLYLLFIFLPQSPPEVWERDMGAECPWAITVQLAPLHDSGRQYRVAVTLLTKSWGTFRFVFVFV